MERKDIAPRDSVRLVTDGACSGNPGPGGWAFILTHEASGKTMESSGAELETTNNRMELAGVIAGLATLRRPCRVEVITDSQYVAKGITEWLPNWKRHGWQRRGRKHFKPLSNVDLWQELDKLLSVHDVRVTHVLGHRGHPENEACDRMAVEAYKTLIEEQRSDHGRAPKAARRSPRSDS
jgi:ribonuclease HI